VGVTVRHCQKERERRGVAPRAIAVEKRERRGVAPRAVAVEKRRGVGLPLLVPSPSKGRRGVYPSISGRRRKGREKGGCFSSDREEVVPGCSKWMVGLRWVLPALVSSNEVAVISIARCAGDKEGYPPCRVLVLFVS